MLIYGVGDEILLGIIGSIICLAGCYFGVILLLKGINGRLADVHPDSSHQVDAVRRERRQLAQAGNGTAEDIDSTLFSTPTETSAWQDTCCPVCLDPEMQHGVETNCGHRFCAQCILEYWRHDQWPQPARCPVCRRPVTLLLRILSGNSSYSEELSDEIVDYNQRMSGQWRPLIHYLYDVPILLRHLWRELSGARGPLLLRRLYLGYFLLVLLFYVISPLDILPEAVFGIFGLLDDVVFVIVIGVYISYLYRAFLTQRH